MINLRGVDVESLDEPGERHDMCLASSDSVCACICAFFSQYSTCRLAIAVKRESIYKISPEP